MGETPHNLSVDPEAETIEAEMDAAGHLPGVYDPAPDTPFEHMTLDQRRAVLEQLLVRKSLLREEAFARVTGLRSKLPVGWREPEPLTSVAQKLIKDKWVLASRVVQKCMAEEAAVRKMLDTLPQRRITTMTYPGVERDSGRPDYAYIHKSKSKLNGRPISRKHCWLTGAKVVALGWFAIALIVFQTVGSWPVWPSPETTHEVPVGTTKFLQLNATNIMTGGDVRYFFATNETVLIARVEGIPIVNFSLGDGKNEPQQYYATEGLNWWAVDFPTEDWGDNSTEELHEMGYDWYNLTFTSSSKQFIQALAIQPIMLGKGNFTLNYGDPALEYQFNATGDIAVLIWSDVDFGNLSVKLDDEWLKEPGTEPWNMSTNVIVFQQLATALKLPASVEPGVHTLTFGGMGNTSFTITDQYDFDGDEITSDDEVAHFLEYGTSPFIPDVWGKEYTYIENFTGDIANFTIIAGRDLWQRKSLEVFIPKIANGPTDMAFFADAYYGTATDFVVDGDDGEFCGNYSISGYYTDSEQIISVLDENNNVVTGPEREFFNLETVFLGYLETGMWHKINYKVRVDILREAEIVFRANEMQVAILVSESQPAPELDRDGDGVWDAEDLSVDTYLKWEPNTIHQFILPVGSEDLELQFQVVRPVHDKSTSSPVEWHAGELGSLKCNIVPALRLFGVGNKTDPYYWYKDVSFATFWGEGGVNRRILTRNLVDLNKTGQPYVVDYTSPTELLSNFASASDYYTLVFPTVSEQVWSFDLSYSATHPGFQDGALSLFWDLCYAVVSENTENGSVDVLHIYDFNYSNNPAEWENVTISGVQMKGLSDVTAMAASPEDFVSTRALWALNQNPAMATANQFDWDSELINAIMYNTTGASYYESFDRNENDPSTWSIQERLLRGCIDLKSVKRLELNDFGTYAQGVTPAYWGTYIQDTSHCYVMDSILGRSKVLQLADNSQQDYAKVWRSFNETINKGNLTYQFLAEKTDNSNHELWMGLGSSGTDLAMLFYDKGKIKYDLVVVATANPGWHTINIEFDNIARIFNFTFDGTRKITNWGYLGAGSANEFLMYSNWNDVGTKYDVDDMMIEWYEDEATSKYDGKNFVQYMTITENTTDILHKLRLGIKYDQKTGQQYLNYNGTWDFYGATLGSDVDDNDWNMMTGYSGAAVIERYNMTHANVAKLTPAALTPSWWTGVQRDITSPQNNGSIDFWFQLATAPAEFHIFLGPTSAPAIELLVQNGAISYHNGSFNWVKLADVWIGPWFNVHLEFNCSGAADYFEFALSGANRAYVANNSFTNNVDTIGSLAFKTVGAVVRFDSVGFSWDDNYQCNDIAIADIYGMDQLQRVSYYIVGTSGSNSSELGYYGDGDETILYELTWNDIYCDYEYATVSGIPTKVQLIRSNDSALDGYSLFDKLVVTASYGGCSPYQLPWVEELATVGVRFRDTLVLETTSEWNGDLLEGPARLDYDPVSGDISKAEDSQYQGDAEDLQYSWAGWVGYSPLLSCFGIGFGLNKIIVHPADAFLIPDELDVETMKKIHFAALTQELRDIQKALRSAESAWNQILDWAKICYGGGALPDVFEWSIAVPGFYRFQVVGDGSLRRLADPRSGVGGYYQMNGMSITDQPVITHTFTWKEMKQRWTNHYTKTMNLIRYCDPDAVGQWVPWTYDVKLSRTEYSVLIGQIVDIQLPDGSTCEKTLHGTYQQVFDDLKLSIQTSIDSLDLRDPVTHEMREVFQVDTSKSRHWLKRTSYVQVTRERQALLALSWAMKKDPNNPAWRRIGVRRLSDLGKTSMFEDRFGHPDMGEYQVWWLEGDEIRTEWVTLTRGMLVEILPDDVFTRVDFIDQFVYGGRYDLEALIFSLKALRDSPDYDPRFCTLTTRKELSDAISYLELVDQNADLSKIAVQWQEALNKYAFKGQKGYGKKNLLALTDDYTHLPLNPDGTLRADIDYISGCWHKDVCRGMSIARHLGELVFAEGGWINLDRRMPLDVNKNRFRFDSTYNEYAGQTRLFTDPLGISAYSIRDRRSIIRSVSPVQDLKLEFDFKPKSPSRVLGEFTHIIAQMRTICQRVATKGFPYIDETITYIQAIRNWFGLYSGPNTAIRPGKDVPGLAKFLEGSFNGLKGYDLKSLWSELLFEIGMSDQLFGAHWAYSKPLSSDEIRYLQSLFLFASGKATDLDAGFLFGTSVIGAEQVLASSKISVPTRTLVNNKVPNKYRYSRVFADLFLDPDFSASGKDMVYGLIELGMRGNVITGGKTAHFVTGKEGYVLPYYPATYLNRYPFYSQETQAALLDTLNAVLGLKIDPKNPTYKKLLFVLMEYRQLAARKFNADYDGALHQKFMVQKVGATSGGQHIKYTLADAWRDCDVDKIFHTSLDMGAVVWDPEIKNYRWIPRKNFGTWPMHQGDEFRPMARQAARAEITTGDMIWPEQLVSENGIINIGTYKVSAPGDYVGSPAHMKWYADRIYAEMLQLQKIKDLEFVKHEIDIRMHPSHKLAEKLEIIAIDLKAREMFNSAEREVVHASWMNQKFKPKAAWVLGQILSVGMDAFFDLWNIGADMERLKAKGWSEEEARNYAFMHYAPEWILELIIDWIIGDLIGSMATSVVTTSLAAAGYSGATIWAGGFLTGMAMGMLIAMQVNKMWQEVWNEYQTWTANWKDDFNINLLPDIAISETANRTLKKHISFAAGDIVGIETTLQNNGSLHWEWGTNMYYQNDTEWILPESGAPFWLRTRYAFSPVGEDPSGYTDWWGRWNEHDHEKYPWGGWADNLSSGCPLLPSMHYHNGAKNGLNYTEYEWPFDSGHYYLGPTDALWHYEGVTLQPMASVQLNVQTELASTYEEFTNLGVNTEHVTVEGMRVVEANVSDFRAASTPILMNQTVTDMYEEFGSALGNSSFSTAWELGEDLLGTIEDELMFTNEDDFIVFADRAVDLQCDSAPFGYYRGTDIRMVPFSIDEKDTFVLLTCDDAEEYKTYMAGAPGAGTDHLDDGWRAVAPEWSRMEKTVVRETFDSYDVYDGLDHVIPSGWSYSGVGPIHDGVLSMQYDYETWDKVVSLQDDSATESSWVWRYFGPMSTGSVSWQSNYCPGYETGGAKTDVTFGLGYGDGTNAPAENVLTFTTKPYDANRGSIIHQDHTAVGVLETYVNPPMPDFYNYRIEWDGVSGAAKLFINDVEVFAGDFGFESDHCPNAFFICTNTSGKTIYGEPPWDVQFLDNFGIEYDGLQSRGHYAANAHAGLQTYPNYQVFIPKAWFARQSALYDLRDDVQYLLNHSIPVLADIDIVPEWDGTLSFGPGEVAEGRFSCDIIGSDNPNVEWHLFGPDAFSITPNNISTLLQEITSIDFSIMADARAPAGIYEFYLVIDFAENDSIIFAQSYSFRYAWNQSMWLELFPLPYLMPWDTEVFFAQMGNNGNSPTWPGVEVDSIPAEWLSTLGYYEADRLVTFDETFTIWSDEWNLYYDSEEISTEKFLTPWQNVTADTYVAKDMPSINYGWDDFLNIYGDTDVNDNFTYLTYGTQPYLLNGGNGTLALQAYSSWTSNNTLLYEISGFDEGNGSVAIPSQNGTSYNSRPDLMTNLGNTVSSCVSGDILNFALDKPASASSFALAPLAWSDNLSFWARGRDGTDSGLGYTVQGPKVRFSAPNFYQGGGRIQVQTDTLQALQLVSSYYDAYITSGDVLRVTFAANTTNEVKIRLTDMGYLVAEYVIVPEGNSFFDKQTVAIALDPYPYDHFNQIKLEMTLDGVAHEYIQLFDVRVDRALILPETTTLFGMTFDEDPNDPEDLGDLWTLGGTAIPFIIPGWSLATQDTYVNSSDPRVNYASSASLNFTGGEYPSQVSYLSRAALPYLQTNASLFLRVNATGPAGGNVYVYYAGSFVDDWVTWRHVPEQSGLCGNASVVTGENTIWINSSSNDFAIIASKNWSAGNAFASLDDPLSVILPSFWANISKVWHGNGLAYMQTNTSESLWLQSPKFTDVNLSANDWVYIRYATNSSEGAVLRLLHDGDVKETITLSPSEANLGAMEWQYFNLTDEFQVDQIEVRADLTDGQYFALDELSLERPAIYNFTNASLYGYYIENALDGFAPPTVVYTEDFEDDVVDQPPAGWTNNDNPPDYMFFRVINDKTLMMSDNQAGQKVFGYTDLGCSIASGRLDFDIWIDTSPGGSWIQEYDVFLKASDGTIHGSLGFDVSRDTHTFTIAVGSTTGTTQFAEETWYHVSMNFNGTFIDVSVNGTSELAGVSYVGDTIRYLRLETSYDSYGGMGQFDNFVLEDHFTGTSDRSIITELAGHRNVTVISNTYEPCRLLYNVGNVTTNGSVEWYLYVPALPLGMNISAVNGSYPNFTLADLDGNLTLRLVGPEGNASLHVCAGWLVAVNNTGGAGEASIANASTVCQLRTGWSHLNVRLIGDGNYSIAVDGYPIGEYVLMNYSIAFNDTWSGLNVTLPRIDDVLTYYLDAVGATSLPDYGLLNYTAGDNWNMTDVNGTNAFSLLLPGHWREFFITVPRVYTATAGEREPVFRFIDSVTGGVIGNWQPLMTIQEFYDSTMMNLTSLEFHEYAGAQFNYMVNITNNGNLIQSYDLGTTILPELATTDFYAYYQDDWIPAMYLIIAPGETRDVRLSVTPSDYYYCEFDLTATTSDTQVLLSAIFENDIIPYFVDVPSDAEFEWSTLHALNWTVIDHYAPGATWTVYDEEDFYATGSWEESAEGYQIEVHIWDLQEPGINSLGEHTLMICVTDGQNDTVVEDVVVITLFNADPRAFMSPEDEEFEWLTPAEVVVWVVFDLSVWNTGLYNVIIDDVRNWTDHSWFDFRGENLFYVDFFSQELDPGYHNITIFLWDDLGGSMQDWVNISIHNTPPAVIGPGDLVAYEVNYTIRFQDVFWNIYDPSVYNESYGYGIGGWYLFLYDSDHDFIGERGNEIYCGKGGTWWDEDLEEEGSQANLNYTIDFWQEFWHHDDLIEYDFRINDGYSWTYDAGYINCTNYEVPKLYWGAPDFPDDGAIFEYGNTDNHNLTWCLKDKSTDEFANWTAFADDVPLHDGFYNGTYPQNHVEILPDGYPINYYQMEVPPGYENTWDLYSGTAAHGTFADDTIDGHDKLINISRQGDDDIFYHYTGYYGGDDMNFECWVRMDSTAGSTFVKLGANYVRVPFLGVEFRAGGQVYVLGVDHDPDATWQPNTWYHVWVDYKAWEEPIFNFGHYRVFLNDTCIYDSYSDPFGQGLDVGHMNYIVLEVSEGDVTAYFDGISDSIETPYHGYKFHMNLFDSYGGWWCDGMNATVNATTLGLDAGYHSVSIRVSDHLGITTTFTTRVRVTNYVVPDITIERDLINEFWDSQGYETECGYNYTDTNPPLLPIIWKTHDISVGPAGGFYYIQYSYNDGDWINVTETFGQGFTNATGAWWDHSLIYFTPPKTGTPVGTYKFHVVLNDSVPGFPADTTPGSGFDGHCIVNGPPTINAPGDGSYVNYRTTYTITWTVVSDNLFHNGWYQVYRKQYGASSWTAISGACGTVHQVGDQVSYICSGDFVVSHADSTAHQYKVVIWDGYGLNYGLSSEDQVQVSAYPSWYLEDYDGHYPSGGWHAENYHGYASAGSTSSYYSLYQNTDQDWWSVNYAPRTYGRINTEANWWFTAYVQLNQMTTETYCGIMLYYNYQNVYFWGIRKDIWGTVSIHNSMIVGGTGWDNWDKVTSSVYYFGIEWKSDHTCRWNYLEGGTWKNAQDDNWHTPQFLPQYLGGFFREWKWLDESSRTANIWDCQMAIMQ